MFRVACVAGVVAALVAGACSYTLPEVPPSATVEPESSTLLTADGNVLAIVHGEQNRQSVPLSDVPPHLSGAVVAAEDARFYRHGGLDVRAMLRAGRSNAVAGEVVEGGSTITQQFAKNAVLADRSRDVDRKVEEALLARTLEGSYTKEEILELYLNAVYFGHGAYGVAAAAQQMFGKPVQHLTLGESALLAGLTRAPEALDPWQHPAAALQRRAMVIDRMVELGFVDVTSAAAAHAEPLVLADPYPPAADPYQAPHFVEAAKQWILDDVRFGPTREARTALLFEGGLTIHTTVDLKVQGMAEAAVASVLPPGGAGPLAAVVALEPSTGRVRALVGGPDFFAPTEGARFDLATQGRRQAGSAFKPLVLAAALEKGIPPSARFPAPPTIDLPQPYRQVWHVSNYDGASPAPDLDLAEATIRSVNTVYAQLITALGPKAAVEAVARYGIASPLEPFPSAVLGANSVTPLDMASAYGTLANRGTHVPPAFVSRVVGRDGNVIYEQRDTARPVLAPEVADTVTAILEQVIFRGTGRRAAIGRPAAGKTGTAQEWRDAWFAGYTPDLATVVWVGFPTAQISMQPPATPFRVTGGSWPAEIWQRFMTQALAGVPPRPFVAPPQPGAPPSPRN